ncbi:hypothetical protein BV25DRAFT_1842537 [Artomyces pyxidatus]|uniref:Uncharacterized protein n=1 Tax=Artomyces pyxidatus TaxID=48021 RepID=A0ACB8SHT8_9AGAM|nr:hypothetical protein BV25DRAFT_1842537 [Artomyces pyxidatus]
MDPLANLQNVAMIPAAGAGGTVWTDNTPPPLPPLPVVIVDRPIGSRLVEIANLYLLHESLRFASSNPWSLSDPLLETAERVIGRIIWHYTAVQQSLPIHLRRPIENEFLQNVGGNMALFRAVALGTARLRTRFRQGSTAVEAVHPNGEVTEEERIQGHGFLARDANGAIPSPDIIRMRVANLLHNNIYLHSGRVDANNNLIEDFRNPAIYAIVNRSIYHGLLPGELVAITANASPAQFAESIGQRVPIGAVLMAAVTDRWILDCRAVSGTREDRNFSSDVYYGIFVALRNRYIFLRSNPQWAAEDTAFRYLGGLLDLEILRAQRLSGVQFSPVPRYSYNGALGASRPRPCRKPESLSTSLTILLEDALTLLGIEL